MRTWTIRLKLKKTKFFFGKQLKLNVELLLDENRLLFLNLIQHWLQIASDI